MRGALLHIEIWEEKGECLVQVGDNEPIHTDRSTAYVEKLREQMAQSLRSARYTLGSDRAVDLGAAEQCLSEINAAGRLALQKLLGARLITFRQQVQDALGSRAIGTGANDMFPLIDVRMPINFLQVEMLPIAHGGALSMADGLDLTEAVRRFPGFSFVTRRLPPRGSLPQDTVIKGAPVVPLKMFYHAGLVGAHDEAEFLARNFDLDGSGPWPEDPAHDSVSAVRAMVDCERDFAGVTKPVLDQIHHFSCHGAQTAEEFPQPLLELCADGGIPFWIYGDDFSLALEEAATSYERPFAFLNACVTNSPGNDTIDTWAVTLLQNGYRGVVGTEAPMPDASAATFSTIFYGELLARRTVGQSLQQAKWKMLRRWNNPIGLFYTLFGNPDLQIN